VAFDLVTTGLRRFSRLDWAFAQRKIARDPLSGVVDGQNRVFFTNYAPILTSGSFSVYLGASPLSGVVDTETGEVTTGSGPTTQPIATYTFTPYTLGQQMSVLMGGFTEMEGRWSRGWKLVDGGGAEATEQSAQILVVDAGGGDPLSGKETQIAFYMACCRLAYLLMLLTGSANTDFDWRETIRGMSVSKSRRPQNLELALQAAERDLLAALEVAQDVYYVDGENLGAFIGEPMTLEYVETLEWQTASELGDYRGLRSSHALLPFG